jgi:hypothetical protein
MKSIRDTILLANRNAPALSMEEPLWLLVVLDNLIKPEAVDVGFDLNPNW